MMKDFSMHILDIVQNSIRANATKIEIKVTEDEMADLFLFSVADNGSGMSEAFMKEVRNPFTTSRTTRKVGLGIPMLEQTCQQCDGNLEIKSTLGVGTTIIATMSYKNIDRPPMGDLCSSIHIVVVTNPTVQFKYIHKFNNKEYILDTEVVQEILEDVPITEPSVMKWLKEDIEAGLAEITGA